MSRRSAVVLVALAALVLAASAQGDRKPTSKERRLLAAVIDVPPKCARIRVSTVSKKPKWASVAFRPARASCEPFACNGVTIAKKRKGVWHRVTAGSDFECASLYTQVPQPVVQDLDISCR